MLPRKFTGFIEKQLSELLSVTCVFEVEVGNDLLNALSSKQRLFSPLKKVVLDIYLIPRDLHSMPTNMYMSKLVSGG